MLQREKADFLPPKVNSVWQNRGPETGNEFTSDDVGNCSSDLFTLLCHCSYVNCHRRFLQSLPFFLQVKCQIVMDICPLVKARKMDLLSVVKFEL